MTEVKVYNKFGKIPLSEVNNVLLVTLRQCGNAVQLIATDRFGHLLSGGIILTLNDNGTISRNWNMARSIPVLKLDSKGRIKIKDEVR